MQTTYAKLLKVIVHQATDRTFLDGKQRRNENYDTQKPTLEFADNINPQEYRLLNQLKWALLCLSHFGKTKESSHIKLVFGLN